MAKVLQFAAGAAHSQFEDDVQLSLDTLFDIYRGSASALIARGIVSLEQLPGQPGKAKAMASFNADGTVRARGCSNDGWRTEGAKRIRRLSGGGFEVQVTVSPEECQRRREEGIDKNGWGAAALAAIAAASRSSQRALAAGKESIRVARPALRLVWSATD